jgi:hypothetical protein
MVEDWHLIIRSVGKLDNFSPVGVRNVSRFERQAKSSERACDWNAIGAVFQLIDGDKHNEKNAPIGLG